MKKTALRDTGVEITELAFGTSGLGDMPDTYGYSVDVERAHATIRAIFDGPVNVIDSSRNYGFGRSEERIGDVIRERGGLPEGFVISTKLDRDMDTSRFDADRARRSLDESLTALGVDGVGLLHLHDPEHAQDLGEITGPGGAIAELFKMKEEGLAQSVGLAMGRLDMMLPILKNFPFDAIINHNRFTLLNRSANEVFDYAHAADMAIINAAPFASGVLAKGTAKSRLIAYSVATDEELEPVRAIESICAEHNIPLAAAALQFSMRDPRIASTLLGVTKPERIAETIRLAEASIPQPVWDSLLALPYSADDPEANRDYRLG
ncbi:MAG: aldo/keto reductase [Paracoccaceae bacterium]